MKVVTLIFFGVTAAIIMKLFYLQVLAHGYYADVAQRTQVGSTVLPARRGEILLEDDATGDIFKLATNTTLKMIYADPYEIEQPRYVAETLAPFLFDEEREREEDELRYQLEFEALLSSNNEALRDQGLEKLRFKETDELFEAYVDKLETLFTQKTRELILIYAEPLDENLKQNFLAMNLVGFELTEGDRLYAYPNSIPNKEKAAESLVELFGGDKDDQKRWENILKGLNRYQVLGERLDPEVSAAIDEILVADRESGENIFDGIGMRNDYFRFYPEKSLAAQVLGYVDNAKNGQYGVEGSYDEILRGKDGQFISQKDVYGNQITIGESVIEQAEDGADITLTINRSIQLQVERILAAGVTQHQAESGQAIVMNAETGAILAMAHVPTFDPNQYGDAFELEEQDFTLEDYEKIFDNGNPNNLKFYYYQQVSPDIRYEVFPVEKAASEIVEESTELELTEEPSETSENPEPQNEEGPQPSQNFDPARISHWLAYVNHVGPAVYRNRIIQDVYEPGSVFKPLAMAAAINAGEIEPYDTYTENGPLGVDWNVLTEEYDFYIKTFNNKYRGIQTFTQALQYSSNIGMAVVAQKLGPELFYSYLKSFGLTKRTEIGLENETKGNVEHPDGWTESELVTKAFGQGISMTPIQLLQAYTAITNDGSMVKPQLIKKITYSDGSTESFEPEVVRQVLTPETTEKITAMMVNTYESYGANRLPLEDHFVAGKSGTAQTYRFGQAQSGKGTTIGSFVGFGPINDPKFLVLVKLDYPKRSEWGADTSGPIFRDIADYLYDYYNIPPDKNL